MDRFGYPKWVHLGWSFWSQENKSGVPGHPGVVLLTVFVLSNVLLLLVRSCVSVALDRLKYYIWIVNSGFGLARHFERVILLLLKHFIL